MSGLQEQLELDKVSNMIFKMLSPLEYVVNTSLISTPTLRHLLKSGTFVFTHDQSITSTFWFCAVSFCQLMYSSIDMINLHTHSTHYCPIIDLK